jgi:hypothetical protein
MTKTALVALGVLWLASCKAESSAAPSPSASAPGKLSAATVPPPAPAAAPGKHVGSCTIMGVACSDYYGASGDAAKKACVAFGKWSDGPCPPTNVQGTCTKTEPGGLVNRTHTYPPGTPATAKTACDNTPGGVFSNP